MYVRVVFIETGESVTIRVSRTTSIATFQRMVEIKCNVKKAFQRLFFCGKQLGGNNRLFDYGINLNDVVQLSVSKTLANMLPTPSCLSAGGSASDDDNSEEYDSNYFKPGDYVDMKDYYYGAWFMGKLIKIKKDNTTEERANDSRSPVKNDGLIYMVENIKCFEEDAPSEVQLQEIRPIPTELMPLHELKCGDTVLTNYNADYPKERGYWYDALIKEIKQTKKGGFEVVADVFVGTDNAVLHNCNLMFLDQIYKIKPYQLLADRTPEDIAIMEEKPTFTRFDALYCIKCKDDRDKICKNCGCRVCGGKENEDEQLMCDECNHPYHMSCLKPPLTELPESTYWYCPSCKNDENEIVKVGQKLKASKKKTPESMSTSKRDWGNGMACVGRTKQCTIVPSNHFGPIPGVEVGTIWKFRLQVSEAGIHRPPVGGIHGRDGEGAYSIVLSGGYEDDVDEGNRVVYTGSGGRDLSGNKRTALQSCDQLLIRYNRALAFNCNAKVDNVNGATALDWKKGKPVRVVRNYKLQKHSEYAPVEGNRYDGIYKVASYYPQKGSSGFTVWRYVLLRDDPTPAPWTPKGQNRIAKLGLGNIIYPENYIHSIETDKKPNLSGKKKRNFEDTGNKINGEVMVKKLKLKYKLEREAEELIAADTVNKKYWNNCKQLLEKGYKAFLDGVGETFLCTCCQDIVSEPITTKCSHNICKACLKRSFNAGVFQCPTCRAELGSAYSMKINKNLAGILLFFFPCYNVNR